MEIKDYIGQSLIGKTAQFKCDCIFPFNITGRVTGYYIDKNEVVWYVETEGKTIKIGENQKINIDII